MIILPIINLNTFSYHPSDNEFTFAVDYCSEMFCHRSLLNYLPQYSVWWYYFTLLLTLLSYGSDWLSCKKILPFDLIIYSWDFCTDLAATLPYREYKTLYSRQSADIFSWHLCLSRTVSTYSFIFMECPSITLICSEIIHLITGIQNILKNQNFVIPNAHQMYVYQGIRNVRFLECFTQVLNRWYLTLTCVIIKISMSWMILSVFIFKYHYSLGYLVIEQYFFAELCTFVVTFIVFFFTLPKPFSFNVRCFPLQWTFLLLTFFFLVTFLGLP